MKKILSLSIVFVLIFSLSACKGNGDEQTTSATDALGNSPIVSVLCESTEVSAGDTVEIFVHIAQSKYTACFDIYLYADEQLEYQSAIAKGSDQSLILAANLMDDETGEYVAVRGIVASTTDIMDDDIYSIEYKVADDVESGAKLCVNIQVPAYQLGIDERGDEVYSVTEDVQINNLVLTVK